MINKFLFLTFSILFAQRLVGQNSISIVPSQTIDDYVRTVLIPSNGGNVAITKIKHNLMNVSTGKSSSGIASFTDSKALFNISKGLVLMSGDPTDCTLPANSLSGSVLIGKPWDVDLRTIRADIQDASVLEFDFTPECDNISFNYVFASEEYNTFVCTGFNDVFAFFISGQNPDGGQYVNQNVATVPGKPTVPVAINTINRGLCENSDTDRNCTENPCDLDNTTLFVSNNVPASDLYKNFVFNGLTRVLPVSVKLVPGTLYHFKFAISDVGDQNYNSAVFLQAGSFRSCSKPIVSGPSNLCPPTVISITTPFLDGSSYRWYKNGSVVNETSNTLSVSSAGTYKVDLITGTDVNSSDNFVVTSNNCFSCTECISSFYPDPSQYYVLSAWVKEGDAQGTLTSYTNPAFELNFKRTGLTDSTTGPVLATGEIIDGWQRVEKFFKVPATATSVDISMKNLSSSTNVYFDDLRIHPLRANMKSFVYDPITLKLMAEMDENNYATLYEYDHEGDLVRVKKETEKGIVTIQEARDNSSKLLKSDIKK